MDASSPRQMVESQRSVGGARLATLDLPRLRFDGIPLVAAIPIVLILGVLLVVAWISLRDQAAAGGYSTRHYFELFRSSAALSAFGNTALFALISTLVALAVGVPSAWLVERTDLPGKTAVYTAMAMGLLVPGFFTAMGWLFLLHPKIGLLNQLAMSTFNLPAGPVSVTSIQGMGWVQGLNLASLVFIMTTASLRAMNPALEEAAQMSGASFLVTLKRVTLPVAFPSILAAAVLVLTIGISAFDVPLVIGAANLIFTFSTHLYFQTHPQSGAPQYGQAAAAGTSLLLLALVLGWWYSKVLVQARKYQVVTGKNYKPASIKLGRWTGVAWLFVGGYILAAQIAPLLLVLWASLMPYFQLPSLEALRLVSLDNFVDLQWSLVTRGLTNTIILMLAVPTVVVACSVAISWVVLRTRSRFRLVVDYVAFFPQVVPSVIFALGVLLATLFIVRWPVDLYGSLSALGIAYAVVYISLGTRMVNSALIQIHPELDEAAYMSGASTFRALRSVVAPLLKRALANAWLWIALLSYRELTLPMMLFSPDNMTVSVVVWSLWNTGGLTDAAVVAVVVIALMLPLVWGYWRLAGRSATA